jgi:inner membrane protein
MSGKVHSILGALVGLNVLIMLNQGGYAAVFIPLYILGALMPDIDWYKSILGKILFPISFIIYKIFGHRTITHSFLGLLLFNILLKYIITILIKTQYLNYTITSYAHIHFSIGYLTHLFSDMLTYKGVPLLYPYQKNYNFAKIPTKKIPDKLVTSILTILLGITLVLK